MTNEELTRKNEELQAQVEALDKKVKTYERAVLEMCWALAGTVDAKDPYTNGHSERVADYTRMLAKKMGISNAQQKDLYYTALLHDIGKIGIPNEILNKPTRLTKEEFETIRNHTVYGDQILGRLMSIPSIAIAARSHHERYDGTGYPDGLKGEEIPLAARIVAVADSYDAMTSVRTYSGVRPQADVRAEIEKGAGTQFDPKIAALMLEIIDEDKDYEFHA